MTDAAELRMSEPNTIATARLVLRPLRREDGPALFTLINNWNVARWLTRVPWPYRPEDMREFIETVALPSSEGPKPTLAILLDGQPIGAIECTGQATIEEPQTDGSDLGYWIGEPYWGRGYTTEVVSALVDRVFAAPAVAVIRSAFYAGNAASWRVQEKLGFEIVNEVISFCRPQGRELPLICTRLTRAGYEANKRKS
jgi:RimJ/RimL family protein N-acetyltransferase